MAKRGTPAERFKRFVRFDDNGCHTWTGAEIGKGYGQFTVSSQRRGMLAHRFAYEATNGPIPTGLEIDHLCFNRRCVNPAHLEAITHRENIHRSVAKGNYSNLRRGGSGSGGRPKEEGSLCKRGHLWVTENIYVNSVTGTRMCRICKRLLQKQYKQRVLERRRLCSVIG